MSKQKKQTAKGGSINYPTWVVQHAPTPSDRLMICDKCLKGEWCGHGFPAVVHCHVTGHGRMREGSPAEYAAAKAAIKRTVTAGG